MDRVTTNNNHDLDKIYNEIVKKVTEDYEAMHLILQFPINGLC